MSHKHIPTTVGVLLIRKIQGQLYILIQKRIRNKTNPTNGKWEVPQGKIDRTLGLVLSAEKETQEESGLALVGLHQEGRLPQRCFNDATIFSSFRPYWCTEVLGDTAQLALFVIGECRGTPSMTKEATAHKWVTATQLRALLDEGSIFSMDHDVLRIWSESPICPTTNQKAETNRKRPVLAVDCGGVLLRYADEILQKNLALALGCSEELVAEILFTSKLRSKLHRGAIKPSGVWARLREVSKSSVSDSDLRDAWIKSILLIPENIQWLSQMREQFPDVLLVATANIDPMTEDMLMTTSNKWVCNFDMWFSSWRMGVSKPNPLFYKKVEQLTCLEEYKNIFFIDDREINRLEASKSGWETVEVDANQHLESLQIKESIEKWLKTL